MINTTRLENQQRTRSWRFRHLAALLVANIALALGPWSVRLADSGPVSAGFWRLVLALPILLVLMVVNRQRLIDTDGQPVLPIVLALMGGGVMFALDLAAWHLGIEHTRLAEANLFGNSGGLLLMAWSLLSEKRWPHRGEWAALGVTLLGGGVLFGRSLEISSGDMLGDLFCVLAGLFYVFYLVALRDARGKTGSWAALFIASACAAPVVLAIALARGEPLWPGATHLDAGWAAMTHGGWVPLILLAVGTQVLGQGLLVYALRHFSALAIGLALLTQPIVGVLLGWCAFGEKLASWDWLGMALMASALVLARVEGARNER